ncbi:MAG: hypothetical protein ACN4GT_03920 [Gammaproteobacteria bacterium]
MPQTIHNDRWLNNPERRVGRQQLLRAKLASLSEKDPQYGECLAMLEAPLGENRQRAHHA